MATKPIIATPRGEWDARSLALADQAQVNPWPDVSPAANDLGVGSGFAAYQAAGGVGTPWSDTLPAVRMDAVPGPIDSFTLPGPNFGGSGSPFTLFAVAEATDLLQSGMAFWGSTDGINPPVGIYLFIAQDGHVGLILGRNGATTGSYTRSAPGVVSEGDRVIISARREEFPQSAGVSAGPTILRVNGEEVATSLSSGWVDFWFSERMHRANLPSTGGFPGPIDGHDGLYAHLLQFGSSASDEEILQMEAFLSEVWGFNFLSTWFPSGNALAIATGWEPTEQQIIPGGPKPLTIGRPIVEYDVRDLRDPPPYSDGDNLRISQGGVGWKDLEITDPQGRTDAGSVGNDGNVLFVEDGWTPGIDAVRFVASPIGAPAGNGQGNYLGWAGGGAFPLPQNWSGNEYSYIGVMRCTDISVRATLFGGNSGIIPVSGNPKKTAFWVEPDGSVVMHQTDEETSGAIQPGSIFSVQSAPGVVKAGDDIIVTCTHSSLAGPQTGKTIRINGVEVARNEAAFTGLFTEMSAPTLGQAFPQQEASEGDPGVVGGLDRLIVYFAAFGTLMTPEEITAYESFLAGAFQFNFATQWVQG